MAQTPHHNLVDSPRILSPPRQMMMSCFFHGITVLGNTSLPMPGRVSAGTRGLFTTKAKIFLPDITLWDCTLVSELWSICYWCIIGKKSLPRVFVSNIKVKYLGSLFPRLGLGQGIACIAQKYLLILENRCEQVSSASTVYSRFEQGWKLFQRWWFLKSETWYCL